MRMMLALVLTTLVLGFVVKGLNNSSTPLKHTARSVDIALPLNQAEIRPRIDGWPDCTPSRETAIAECELGASQPLSHTIELCMQATIPTGEQRLTNQTGGGSPINFTLVVPVASYVNHRSERDTFNCYGVTPPIRDCCTPSRITVMVQSNLTP